MVTGGTALHSGLEVDPLVMQHVVADEGDVFGVLLDGMDCLGPFSQTGSDGASAPP